MRKLTKGTKRKRGFGGKRKQKIRMNFLRNRRYHPKRKNKEYKSTAKPRTVHRVRINAKETQISFPGITYSKHTVEIHINTKVVTNVTSDYQQGNSSKLKSPGRRNHDHS